MSTPSTAGEPPAGMTRYSVGGLYSTRRQWQEGMDYNYRQGIHELRMFYRDPTKAEVQAVQMGTPRFGLLVDGPCIILLFRFGGQPWCDASYTWHRTPPEERKLPDVPAEGSPERTAMFTMLIDGNGGIIRAMRYCSLSPEFTRALHGAICDQAATPWDDKAYMNHLLRLYEMPTERMVALVQSTGGLFSTGGD